MNTEKVKKWTYDLRRLPNAKRGLASGACSSGALALAIIVYFIAKAMGYKLGTNCLIGFAAIAEMIAAIVFFTWAKAAFKLKEEEKRYGS
ncbi:MAG: hypothetical protein K1000chlam2_00891 [Chlamydiae bacterium]|nr:hypothetical protein [Chlamydiota bacterium]